MFRQKFRITIYLYGYGDNVADQEDIYSMMDAYNFLKENKDG